MRPTVVTAVLLFVCFLGTETAFGNLISPQSVCGRFPDVQCGDGWSRLDEHRCAKLIDSPKNLKDAQEHCRSLDADVVSINSLNQMLHLLCLTWRTEADLREIWIGTVRSEGVIKHLDGSKVEHSQNFPKGETPDGPDCFIMDFSARAKLHVAPCSAENHFVCAKKM